MRTLEDIDKELLQEAQKAMYSLQGRFEITSDRVKTYCKEMMQFRLDNGLYCSMDDLKQYAGKKIRKIELVKKEYDVLEVMTIYGSKVFEVDNSGHLNYSSSLGTMRYDSNEKTYIFLHDGDKTKYNFVGYISVDVDERIV